MNEDIVYKMASAPQPASQPLLSEDFSNTSNEDDDDYIKIPNGSGSAFSSTTNRHQSHRRVRRLTRFILIFATVLVLLLLIYIPIFNHIQFRLVALPGWGYNTSRNTADYVLPGVDTTIMKPHSVCLSKYFLLVVVCSSVENFAARQLIRETWGNTSEFNYPLFTKLHSHLVGQYLDVKELTLRLYSEHLKLENSTNLRNSSHYQNLPVRVVFLIGKTNVNTFDRNETIARLKLESEQYDDLIQEDFLDTYNNLTIKSVMMLKWVINNCQTKAKYLMKCDDDTFVNIPNLLHFLLSGTVPIYNATVEFYDPVTVNTLSPSNRMTFTRNYLTGYLFCMVKPVADTSSKWYSPMYMYKGDIYPKYLSGSSYLMSFDVIPQLYNASLNTSLLHLEDVYLTGICAEKIHLKRRHNPMFSFVHSPNKCSYKGIITQHYVKGDLMRDAYNFVLNTTIRCPPADKYFKIKRLRKGIKNCH